MLEIKDRNHTGRQGAYFADNAARASFLKHTALLGLRWGKSGRGGTEKNIKRHRNQLKKWVDTYNRSRKRKSAVKDRMTERSILAWAALNIHEIVPTQPAYFGRPVRAICLIYIVSRHVTCALIRTRAAAPRILGTPECTGRDHVGMCASSPHGCARFSRCLCDVCVRFVLSVAHHVMLFANPPPRGSCDPAVQGA